MIKSEQHLDVQSEEEEEWEKNNSESIYFRTIESEEVFRRTRSDNGRVGRNGITRRIIPKNTNKREKEMENMRTMAI